MGFDSISVVIPTHNRATIVGRAVESALAATRGEDEVLVVDDGSTDDTEARIRGTFGDRVRLLRTPHVGPGAARNLGIREARMPLVAFLDSDDVWMPDKLDLQRVVMERRPEVVFCFSDFGHRTRTGKELRHHALSWHGDRRSWDEILGPAIPFSALGPLPAGREDFRVHVGDLYLAELQGDYVCTSTVVVRKSRAGAALRFGEDLRRFQDWECFGRLSGAGPAAYLDCETQWNCDDAAHRLSRADELYCETARITILERVWGADRGFLARHGETYRKVLDRHRLARAKELLARGRTLEARQELRALRSRSPVDFTLACLPGPLTRALVAARRSLRRRRPLA